MWRLRAISSKAREASPNDRMHDALVSLRFLIQMEAMAQKIDEVGLIEENACFGDMGKEKKIDESGLYIIFLF